MISIAEIQPTKAVIVGSGVAGMTAALSVGDCTVLTSTTMRSGSTALAQGGIAAAVDPDDSPWLHAADTVSVGGGVVDRAAAEAVAGSARERIEWLESLGARFDQGDGRRLLGREAGHSRPRIVHAQGDATGAELSGTLASAIEMRDDIEVREGFSAFDLLRSGGSVAGVLAADPAGTIVAFVGPVVLATGGIGGLYSRTTNPADVRGAGLAMAARSGAGLVDLEFVQFHPTTLDVEADPRPLLTEALRGAGAVLVDETGRRLMEKHPEGDLAPRSAVARTLWLAHQEGREAYLDATQAIGPDLAVRFPNAFAAATSVGIDPCFQPIPVAPACHYHMGGIATDLSGRTSVPGLFACGEAASTGLHGANRLASNSLLEGLVMGERVASAVRQTRQPRPLDLEVPADGTLPVSGGLDQSMRKLLWGRVGVIRRGPELESAAAEARSFLPSNVAQRDQQVVGELLIEAALTRQESRGAHVRGDHPRSRRAWAQRRGLEKAPVPSRPLARPLRVGAAAR